MNNRIYPKRAFEEALRDYLETESVIKKIRNREEVIDKILKDVDKDSV